MGVDYRPAGEVKTIADRLIATVHTCLDGIRIEYVFRSKAAKSHGRIVAGKARKLSGLNAYLATEGTETDLFVVEIAEDEWKQMGPAARRALVDHELCHLTVDFDEETNTLTLAIRGHDVEEFVEVVERHGIWDDDLKAFAEAMHTQLAMFDDGAVSLVEGLLPDGADSVTLSHEGRSVTVSRDGDGNVIVTGGEAGDDGEAA